ncbi:hypothetical protein EAI_01143, partial [Harpegnathos saltator]
HIPKESLDRFKQDIKDFSRQFVTVGKTVIHHHLNMRNNQNR